MAIKKPTEWVKMLDDEVIPTALLDRLLFRREVINLTSESYSNYVFILAEYYAVLLVKNSALLIAVHK